MHTVLKFSEIHFCQEIPFKDILTHISLISLCLPLRIFLCVNNLPNFNSSTLSLNFFESYAVSAINVLFLLNNNGCLLCNSSNCLYKMVES